jgi:hypothetical protein
MYTDNGLYKQTPNIVLSLIFMNILPDYIKLINNIDILVANDRNDYYEESIQYIELSKTEKSLYNQVKSNFIIDYLSVYETESDKIDDDINTFINKLKNVYRECSKNLKDDNFKKNELRKIIMTNFLKSEYPLLDATISDEIILKYINDEYINIDEYKLYRFDSIYRYKNDAINEYNKKYGCPKDIKNDFNVLIKIMKIVIEYIEFNQNQLINGYNYCLYIKKYKELNQKAVRNPNQDELSYNELNKKYESGKYKAMINFIKMDERKISTKLVFDLTQLTYIAYKTNQESGKLSLNLAQNICMDYFLGISKTVVPYMPINHRETLINITGQNSNNISYIAENDDSQFKNEFDQIFYRNIDIPIKFKLIPQSEIEFTTSYPDCGESTILNFFNYLLLQPNDRFREIESTWDSKIKKFYRKYYNMDILYNSPIRDVKNLWGTVIQDRYQLIQKNMYNRGNHDFKPSIDNFNFLLKILLGLKIEKDYSIIDLIKLINPFIKDDQIIKDGDSTYQTYQINNEIIFKFSVYHAACEIISKIESNFDKKLNKLDKLDKPLLYNNPIKNDISFLFKIGMNKCNINLYNDWDTMIYVNDKYFNYNNLLLDHSKTFFMSQLIIKSEKQKNIIYHELTNDNNIHYIIEYLSSDMKSHKLLQKLYNEYKINGKKIIEYTYDPNIKKYYIDPDQSYLHIYIKNLKTIFESEGRPFIDNIVRNIEATTQFNTLYTPLIQSLKYTYNNPNFYAYFKYNRRKIIILIKEYVNYRFRLDKIDINDFFTKLGLYPYLSKISSIIDKICKETDQLMLGLNKNIKYFNSIYTYNINDEISNDFTSFYGDDYKNETINKDFLKYEEIQEGIFIEDDEDDDGFFGGGYYNKSIKYQNKLKIIKI